MGNVGGNRNYGYGKQLAWAGKNALLDRYGQGHFSTRASHEARWCQFAKFIKAKGFNDVRKITQTVLNQYAEHLRTLVNSGEIKVAYAQNLLSTVNVVLQTMRKDSVLKIHPADCVGHRKTVRTTVPHSLERSVLFAPIDKLQKNGDQNVALTVQLTRAFGLRFREASCLNVRQALKQSERTGRINITQGTKGGRGKGADRWVPVPERSLSLLKAAAQHQGTHNNLIPPDLTYAQWRDHAYAQWHQATRGTAINGFHDMRAAYACERYHQLTGHPAPAVAGERLPDKERDTRARQILSAELGHGRIDVLASYVGSAK